MRVIGPYKLFDNEPFAANANITSDGVGATRPDASVPIKGAAGLFIKMWNAAANVGTLTVNVQFQLRDAAGNGLGWVEGGNVLQDLSTNVAKISGVDVTKGGVGYSIPNLPSGSTNPTVFLVDDFRIRLVRDATAGTWQVYCHAYTVFADHEFVPPRF